jgi:hypothetical protein
MAVGYISSGFRILTGINNLWFPVIFLIPLNCPCDVVVGRAEQSVDSRELVWSQAEVGASWSYLMPLGLLDDGMCDYSILSILKIL